MLLYPGELYRLLGASSLFLAFSPRLPTFINFRTKGFQSHHKEDCVFNVHAHVAVEISELAIKPVHDK